MIKFYCSNCYHTSSDLIEEKNGSFSCSVCRSQVFKNREELDEYVLYDQIEKKPFKQPRKFKENYG